MASSTSFPEDDDDHTLSLLLLPCTSSTTNSNGREGLTAQLFDNLSSRFLSDTTTASHISSPNTRITTVHGSNNELSYWDQILETARRRNFEIDYSTNTTDEERPTTTTTNSCTAATIDSSNLPADFQTEAGKIHLAALCSLLNVSPIRAVSITKGAHQSMESTAKRLNNDATGSTPSLSSLLGTRTFFLSVRTYHYQQQIARLRFLAESIRGEKQDNPVETDTELRIKDLTGQFLNRLDDRSTATVGGGGGGRRRGLFRLLVGVACAPVGSLGPERITPSGELTAFDSKDQTQHQTNEFLSTFSSSNTNSPSTHEDITLTASLSPHDFSRRLMEQHMTQHECDCRTEALEALFALLYERIEGGVNRADYMMLCLAFDTQHFFTSPAPNNGSSEVESNDGRRRSQLAALIMAESLSLWRFTNDTTTDNNSNSENSHPFLAGDDASLERELQCIGRDLFLNEFASKMKQRRRIALSHNTNAITQRRQQQQQQHEDGDVEVPESIALLTFGVILKLASQKKTASGATTGNTLLGPFMKELGFQCVSVANDQCGAFAYLQSIMTNLLPSSASTVQDVFGAAGKTREDVDCFDWNAYAMKNCNDTTDAIAIENGGGEKEEGESDEMRETEEGDNAVAIVYASIGREILVGTLAAFKNSLLCDSISSKEDNIGMFCNLAAQTYQNNSVLCDSFWANWDHYCSTRPTTGGGMAVSDDVVIGADTDSLCHLLDAAYLLASNTLNTNIVDRGGGESSASMLPSLVPLLRLISSIIPSHGGNVCDVISTFFLDNMAHVCLQGCAYLCSLTDAKILKESPDAAEIHERLLQAALGVMTSLHSIARLMSKSEDERGIELLQNALEPVDNVNGARFVVSSPALLYNIASFSLHNVNFSKNQRVALASAALGTMTELLRCETANDFLWTTQVGKCLCQNVSNGMRIGFGLFVEEGMEEVTALSMALLQKMSLSVTEFVASSTQENILLEYITTVGDGALTACRLLPLTLTCSVERHRIAFGAISSIYILIRALAGIMEWHEIDCVKKKANSILLELIETISLSSTIQGALGFYATFPVAVGLASVIQKNPECITDSKDLASDVKSTRALMQHSTAFDKTTFLSLKGRRVNGTKQDVDISSLTQQVDGIPLPYENDSKMLLTVFKLAHKSMSLLFLWGKMSERFAIEEHTESEGCVSLHEAIDGFDKKNIQDIESDLQSNGPVRILLSCPVPPVTDNVPASSYDWPANRIPVLNLITRYIGWCSEDDNGPSKIKTDLAVKAVKLLSMGMIHSNLSESWQKPVKIGSTSLLHSIHPASICSIGSQVHAAQLKLLQNLPRGRECREFNQKKSVLTLHLLNMLSRSVVFLPTLAKHILGGRAMSNECKLIDLIVETLLPARVSSPIVALIASSCADVLHQLWNSCRNNCSTLRESKSSVLLHPCDSVFASLYSKHTVVKTCSSVLLNQETMMNQVKITSLRHDEDSVEKPAITYVKSAILNIVSKSLQILGKETILFMRKNVEQSGTTNDMQEFLKRVFNQNLIGKWYQTMNCFDGAILSARSINSLRILSSPNYNFLTATWNNTPLAIEVVGAFLKTDENQILSNALVTNHSAEYVIRCQANLLSSLSEFGQIAAFVGEGETHLESDPFMMIDQAMIPIRQSAENSFIAFLRVPSSQRRSIVAQTLNVAYELTGSLASHLSEMVAAPPEQARHLVGILEDLLRSSERYLTIVESPIGFQSQHEKYLVCKLRLNVLLSTLLLVDAIKAIERSHNLSQEDQKRFNSSRLVLCRLIGNTLNSLALTKPDENTCVSVVGSGNTQFPYDFNSKVSDNMNHQMINIEGVSLNLLRVAISLLSALLPTTVKASPSLSSNACETELAITFRNCNLISLVLRHLENASDAAASTYQMALDGSSNIGKSVQSSCIHKNSVDMIARIFHFAYCIAESGGLSILMVENRFVQSLMKCKILSHACQHWSALSRGDGNTSQQERGYLKTKCISPFVPAKDFTQMKNQCRKPDPVHNIWRCAIQILTALIRSCNSSNLGSLESINKQCSSAIINFIYTFEDTILSCIQNCSFRTSQEAGSSEFGFTLNLLNEVCDLLSLLSELCNEEYRHQFEASSASFYRKVGEAALDIMKTLSTFMGAVGTARELFSSLSKLNKIMAVDGNEDDESVYMRETYIPHPLMEDGINNGKHQQISNAFYASSCCIFMTDDEYASSQSKMKSSGSSLNDKSESVNMYQNYFDNDFTSLIEDSVAQCMFNALSVIEKVHPANSCFVAFNENEAMHLDLSSIPPSGTMVAIRSHATALNVSSYLSVSDVRYGRISDYNIINRTLDVNYVYSSRFSKAAMVEKGIPLLRLAGIEDISKRKSVLDLYPAPNSVSDTSVNVGTSSGSIGNLIQILCWCRQRALVQIANDNVIGSQKDLVRGIAESATMFLGNEVGMHLELGSFACVSEVNVKKLNKQLLDLFDDEEPKINMSSFEAQSRCSSLKSLIDDDVWRGMIQQIGSLLSSGRVEREKIRKASDENGAHSISIGRPIHSGEERRSPFKMTFAKR